MTTNTDNLLALGREALEQAADEIEKSAELLARWIREDEELVTAACRRVAFDTIRKIRYETNTTITDPIRERVLANHAKQVATTPKQISNIGGLAPVAVATAESLFDWWLPFANKRIGDASAGDLDTALRSLKQNIKTFTWQYLFVSSIQRALGNAPRVRDAVTERTLESLMEAAHREVYQRKQDTPQAKTDAAD